MDGATSTRSPGPRPYTSLNNNTVLVLGLGNTLLADDGIGIHIVRSLGADPATPACLHPVDGGTLGFRLLEQIWQADAVLIIAKNFRTMWRAAGGSARMKRAWRTC
jgi:hypothetical protein